MIRHYCTYFDRNYLFKGLALYDSLARHDGEFALWVLAFDRETQHVLSRLNLPGLRLIAAEQFEQADPKLRKAKLTRSPVEYFWTCTSCLPLYLLRCYPEIELVTYLDADLFFYANPEPIYQELGGRSILIVEHRYAQEHAHFVATSGIFNVGLLAFRNDPEGRSCLEWWRERCLEWCFYRVEDGKLGEQKYLDDWPVRFRQVAVLQHKGAGVAPWNLSQYRITQQAGQVFVDEAPLVFYHFHAFNLLSDGVYETVPANYRVSAEQKLLIYRPYVAALQRVVLAVRQIAPGFRHGFAERGPLSLARSFLSLLLGRLIFVPMSKFWNR